jgi:hypothetical protein
VLGIIYILCDNTTVYIFFFKFSDQKKNLMLALIIFRTALYVLKLIISLRILDLNVKFGKNIKKNVIMRLIKQTFSL